MKLSDIPSGVATRLLRDGEFSSLGFASHRRPGMLTYLAAEEYVPTLTSNDSVSCVLSSPELAEQIPQGLGVAVVDDPRLAFYRLHNHLAKATPFYGKPDEARIATSAKVHPTAFVAPNVVIEDDVEIGPRVVILPGVHIEPESVVRAGSVIGSEGFQVIAVGNEVIRVFHAGTVWIGRGVDIHANCCVDRGLFGQTTVGDGTTIDDLAYVAHEVVIGRRCRIGAHAILNGSAVIGDDAWIGPGAALSNGISLGARANVTIGSVVTRDVPAGARVTGNFAIDHERFLGFLRSIRG